MSPQQKVDFNVMPSEYIIGPDKEGWWDVSEMPSFGPQVKKEINILQEMRPIDGWQYKNTKGGDIFVTMYRYPAGSVTKFTQFKGRKYKNKDKQIIDTRKYKTPYEGTENNCYISYYVADGFDYDIDNNPIPLFKHLQCLPSHFAKLVGWVKGDGLLKGEKIPDTTPVADQAKVDAEVKKVNTDNIKQETLKEVKMKEVKK